MRRTSGGTSSRCGATIRGGGGRHRGVGSTGSGGRVRVKVAAVRRDFKGPIQLQVLDPAGVVRGGAGSAAAKKTAIRAGAGSVAAARTGAGVARPGDRSAGPGAG